MKKLLVSLLLVSSVFVFTGCSSSETVEEKPLASENSNEFAIEAKNFDFNMKEIKVKKGEDVTLSLTNSEGYHGLELADYGITLENGNSTTFTADKEGVFEIKCSIPCGEGHTEMIIKFIVEA